MDEQLVSALSTAEAKKTAMALLVQPLAFIGFIAGTLTAILRDQPVWLAVPFVMFVPFAAAVVVLLGATTKLSGGEASKHSLVGAVANSSFTVPHRLMFGGLGHALFAHAGWPRLVWLQRVLASLALLALLAWFAAAATNMGG